MAKEEKVKKKLNKKALIVILLIIYLVIMGIYYFFNLPIKNIIITGNNLISDEEIIEIANLNNYPKIFTLNTSKVKKNILSLSLISEVSISKSITGKLTIEVTEENILFYNVLEGNYVLEDGTTTEDVPSSLGVPSLVNYVPSDILDGLIENMQEIDLEILSLISEIEYSPDIKDDVTIDENRFLLRMNDGNYVYINLANFSNLDRYQDLYAAVDEGTKGVFNLDSSSDTILFQSFESIAAETEEEETDELSN